ncbi:outer membrane immunogenic protein [Devosia enhydra]|uniref:Outer membrane immunogenic protein n=1 Tax=Devosia enhydra TaxID=665118 RepID=A0A1K2HU42_9HYPH|nr:outer membrane protein [Devosia enhydra]SFZ81861.1 outer membrane immunogenic protein [Devosia enhydra]
MRFTKTLMLAAAVVAAPAAAQAADLYVPAPPVVAAPMVSGLWEGPYVGVHVGYISAEADHTSGPGTNDISPSGWLLGAQVGANFYLSDAVVGGVVADISWSNASGDITTFDTVQTIDWEGSLRAKLGFDGGNFMPYITGGLAVAGGTRSNNLPEEDSQTHIGWTIGAGVDVAVADNVSLNLEYRYSDYGDAVYDTGGINPTIALTSHAIRAGVNFHF